MQAVIQLRPGWAVKAIMVIVIASILLRCVSVSAAATNHTVGGPSGWDLSSNIPAWSSTTIFRVGDSLVFSYSPIHDVLEVDQVGYATCRTVNPINVYNDGETVVPLTQTGTRFFICGRSGHCAMGLRFHVDVLPRLASSNETSHRGPIRSPPPRRHYPPPPPSSQLLPPIPKTPPFEGPPPPPAAAAAASTCETSGAAGMVMVDYYNWWVWVPLVTSII